MRYLVILDDGHGNNTAGKRSPQMEDGTVMKENSFNRDVVAKLQEQLEYNNIDVYLTAPELEDVPLATRSARANAKYREYVGLYGKDGFKCVFISVHANAYKGTFGSWGGIDTFYYKHTKTGDKFAEIVQKHLVKGSPLRDRGTKPCNFHVTRETIMTAVLVELGFMDSEHDIKFLLDDGYRSECARELLEAICEYFNVVYMIKKPKPKTRSIFKVSVGAFGSHGKAVVMAERLKEKGFEDIIIQEDLLIE